MKARIWPLGLLASAFCLPASAQYYIDWSTIDGGGGTSTGGVYSVTGTIGQPDAGAMSGGPFTLQGGFWSVVAVQTEGAPRLSVVQTSANVTIYWPLPATGFVLDQTSALASPPATNAWTQVPFPYQTNATHIFISVPPPGGPRYYRLRK